MTPIDLVLLDLDGTVYLGERLLPGARLFLDALRRAGIAHAFLTNNSSIAPGDYLGKLRRLGLLVTPVSILTSAEATVLMLRHHRVRLDRVFVLGTGRLVRYLASQGIGCPAGRPRAVLVGFDQELTWAKLNQACALVRQGADLFATHEDLNCPMPGGPIVDAGSILSAIYASTGLRPIDVAGKPNRWMIDLARRNFGVPPRRMAMIGDRLNTDVRMAKRFGLTAVLITARPPKPGRPQPDFVAPSLASLMKTPWFNSLVAR